MSTANDSEDQVLPQQHLQERFMTKEEQVAYEFQALRRIIKELKKSGSVKQDHWKGPMPRELLLDLLETTNYNNPDSCSKAVSELTSSGLIPIGKDNNGDFYCIVPRFRALLADQPHPATNNELVEEDILGVNINVQPPEPAHPRTADLPKQSTVLNDSLTTLVKVALYSFSSGGSKSCTTGKMERCIVCRMHWKATGWTLGFARS